MSEKPIEKCCGTCVHWGPDGFRLMTDPPMAPCTVTVPFWVIRDEHMNHVRMGDEGQSCPCHTPKPETQP